MHYYKEQYQPFQDHLQETIVLDYGDIQQIKKINLKHYFLILINKLENMKWVMIWYLILVEIT